MGGFLCFGNGKIWLYPVSFDCAALCDYHFINGPSGLTAPKQKETEVSVQSGGNDRMTTMSLDAYGMGVLAKEISMDMDIETIKRRRSL